MHRHKSWIYLRTYLNSAVNCINPIITHPPPPQLLVDADILPTLLLLLDHSNSAVQTNAAWALMVRGEGEGRRRGGEGRETRRGGQGRGREGTCADECGK